MKTRVFFALIFLFLFVEAKSQFDSYDYKKVITIDHTQIGSDLSNYPLLINAHDADLKSTANGGNVQSPEGYDIAFYDKNSVRLDHEIELYNAATGEYVAWVRIPTLSASEDTKIFLVYGKTGVSTNPSTTNTWNDDFLAVYHFNEDETATTFTDATSNASNGTAPAAITRVAGKAGYGRQFDGTDDYIRVADADLHSDFPSKSGSTTTEFTVSAWVLLESTADRGPFVSKQTDGAGSGDRGYVFMLETNQTMKLEAFQSDNSDCSNGRWEIYSSSTVNTGTWYNLSVTYKFDGTDSESRLYIDGTEVSYNQTCGTAPVRTGWGPIQSNDRDFDIGRYYWASVYKKYFNGKMDELRVSKKAHSADWVAVEYTNVVSSTDLYTVGDEEAINLYKWEGTEGTDWSQNTNWLPATLPTSGIDVIIPASPDGGNFPQTNSGTTAECKSLTIESGGKLHIPPGKALRLSGDLKIDGTLSIKSDNTGTGSLLDNGTISGAGDVFVERFIWLDRWHYLSLPVQSANSQMFTHTAHGWNPNFYYYDESQQWPNGWTYAHDGESGSGVALKVTKGYAYYYNGYETRTFSGTLNTGTFTTGQGGLPALSYTDFDNDGDDSQDGWNLIGNPYPSAVDWDALARTNIDNSIYFWRNGNYEYYVGTAGTDYEATGTTRGSAHIPAMQAFFVKANAENPEISFTNTARTITSETFHKKEGKNKKKAPFVRLKAENGSYQDETVIRFIPEATQEHDGLFDAYKIFTTKPEVPQIYSVTEMKNQNLAINSRPYYNENNSIQLGFKAGQSGRFTIAASETFFEDQPQIWLEDTQTGIWTDLNSNSYHFDYQTSDAPLRFVLHCQNQSSGSEQVHRQEEIKIYSEKDQIFVELTSQPSLDTQIQVFDLTSKKILTHQPSSQAEKIHVSAPAGIYIVKVISTNCTKTQRVFIAP